MRVQAVPNEVPGRAAAEPRAKLVTLLERFARTDGAHQTAFAPLVLYRMSGVTAPIHSVQQPALCVVAQGSKRVMLGDEVHHYDPASYLLVSVDLPITGQVLEATPEAPYLSLRLDLDHAQVGALAMDVSRTLPDPRRPRRCLAVSRVDGSLLDAITRLVRLLDTPRDLPVLAPLVYRETLYRLLVGEQGSQLLQIAAAGSSWRGVTEAIDWLKRHFAEPLRIEDLARRVSMSPSALHRHFKAVTAMTPLHYQKRLRLQEARRIMLTEGVAAATAAFRVGYESPPQFSREYRRLFGLPPSRDVARLRGACWPETLAESL